MRANPEESRCGAARDASVASNVRVATTDLGALRAEVEVSLRKVEQLVTRSTGNGRLRATRS